MRSLRKTVENPETQISDVVIDACLTCDAKCKVACETCVKDNMFMVIVEITVAGKLHHETVVRGVMSNIEFDSSIDDFSSVDSRRLNHQDCEGLFQVGKQSPDIVDGVRVDRDDLHAMFTAARTQQPHRNKQYHDSQQQQATNKQQRQQAGQTEEEEKEEGKRRKGERGKEEERDAEEQECKQVKKDATVWTVVTRNKRQRKMVQIFVKVDEAKVTPMDVSLTDGKVEDVIRQVQKDEDVFVTMQGKALRRNEKLKSCGVTDGCTIQVTSRMRGGGRHKDKRSKADTKRGMDESGQKDQQVESLIDKCQEATQAQKDEMIQLFEENDAYRKMITMIQKQKTRNTRYNASENNFSQGLTRKERS